MLSLKCRRLGWKYALQFCSAGAVDSLLPPTPKNDAWNKEVLVPRRDRPGENVCGRLSSTAAAATSPSVVPLTPERLEFARFTSLLPDTLGRALKPTVENLRVSPSNVPVFTR